MGPRDMGGWLASANPSVAHIVTLSRGLVQDASGEGKQPNSECKLASESDGDCGCIHAMHMYVHASIAGIMHMLAWSLDAPIFDLKKERKEKEEKKGRKKKR